MIKTKQANFSSLPVVFLAAKTAAKSAPFWARCSAVNVSLAGSCVKFGQQKKSYLLIKKFMKSTSIDNRSCALVNNMPK